MKTFIVMLNTRNTCVHECVWIDIKVERLRLLPLICVGELNVVIVARSLLGPLYSVVRLAPSMNRCNANTPNALIHSLFLMLSSTDCWHYLPQEWWTMRFRQCQWELSVQFIVLYWTMAAAVHLSHSSIILTWSFVHSSMLPLDSYRYRIFLVGQSKKKENTRIIRFHSFLFPSPPFSIINRPRPIMIYFGRLAWMWMYPCLSAQNIESDLWFCLINYPFESIRSSVSANSKSLLCSLFATSPNQSTRYHPLLFGLTPLSFVQHAHHRKTNRSCHQMPPAHFNAVWSYRIELLCLWMLTAIVGQDKRIYV